MNCRRCGKELRGLTKCEFCGYENVEGNVREMTHTEKNFYNGITIDEDGTNYEEQRQSGKNFRYNRSYVSMGETGIFSRLAAKFISALISGNTLAKIALSLIFLAFAALMFFIAVPVVFFLIAVGAAFWLYAKFIKKF